MFSITFLPLPASRRRRAVDLAVHHLLGDPPAADVEEAVLLEGEFETALEAYGIAECFAT